MAKMRRSAVGGMFYDDDPAKLRKNIETLLQKVATKNKLGHQNLMGIIVPHAGYVYSGQAAACGYNELRERDFDRAIILAPSHHVGGFYFSVGDFDFYRTPLGNIEVCRESVEKLLTEKHFEFSPFAHLREHSIEVQLPFLQVINPKAKIVPIVFGDQHLNNSSYLADVLLKYFGDDLDKTVFIVSSDLSHYHDANTAEKKDGRFIELILKNDFENIFKEIKEKKIEACGFGGILTIMKIASLRGNAAHKMFCYYTSGEINKDFRQVVGYYAGGVYIKERQSNA